MENSKKEASPNKDSFRDDLVKLADELDKAGDNSRAAVIDALIKKLAQAE